MAKKTPRLAAVGRVRRPSVGVWQICLWVCSSNEQRDGNELQNVARAKKEDKKRLQKKLHYLQKKTRKSLQIQKKAVPL